MNARLESVGHGDGKVYLQMVLDRLHADAAVVLEARLKDGTAVPAHLFPFTPLDRSSQANYVVVLPHLAVREVDLSFLEHADGAPLSQSRLTVELNMVRWRTRFNALVRSEMLAQMLDIEREYCADRMNVRFTDVVPDGDDLVVKMLVDMPYREGADVMVDFADLAGHDIDLPVYPLREEVEPPARFGDDSRLAVGFSVRVRAEAKDFCVTVYDAQGHVAGGFAVFCDETHEPLEHRHLLRATDAGVDAEYGAWYQRHCETLAGLAVQRGRTLPCQPLVSLVIPAFAGDECYLAATLRAIRQQTYAKFEVVLVDGGLDAAFCEAALGEWEGDGRLVRIALGDADEGSARLTGLLQSTGDACAVIDPAVILAPEALFEYARRVSEVRVQGADGPGVAPCDVAYAHHDAYSRTDGFCAPEIKPAFSVELLCSYEYMGPVVFVSRRVIDAIAQQDGFASEAFSYDFVLKTIERAERIERIDRVLYHVQDAVSISPEAERIRVRREEEAFRGGRKAVANFLRRSGADATVLAEVADRCYRVRYRLPDEPPALSVVLMPGVTPELTEGCLASMRAAVSALGCEVVVLDEGSAAPAVEVAREWFGPSRVTVLSCAPSASRAVAANAAVRATSSEYVFLVEGDSEFVDADGLECLLARCLRSGVGVVGAKLLNPDDTICHAGMAVGAQGLAVEIGADLPRSMRGYGRRFVCASNMSAVSGSAMMLRRAVFDEVGGFDERFSVAGWDVDFCLKALKAGFEVVYDGGVELYCRVRSAALHALTHAQRLRAERERAFFRYRWPGYFVDGDPFMSACLDPDSPYYRLNSAD